MIEHNYPAGQTTGASSDCPKCRLIEHAEELLEAAEIILTVWHPKSYKTLSDWVKLGNIIDKIRGKK